MTFDALDMPPLHRELFNKTAEVFNVCGIHILLLVLLDNQTGQTIVTAPHGTDKAELVVLLKDFIRRIEQ